MTIQLVDMWLAVVGILLTGVTMGILIVGARRLRISFGTYTERIERSGLLVRQSEELTRQSNERTMREIGHARKETVTLMNQLRKVQDDLTTERSA
jgi:uncharacterized membrane protein (DUF106 family)